jgi:hypothetical protein
MGDRHLSVESRRLGVKVLVRFTTKKFSSDAIFTYVTDYI